MAELIQRPIPTPKTELHQKKILLSVWFDAKEFLCWELLPDNTIVS